MSDKEKEELCEKFVGLAKKKIETSTEQQVKGDMELLITSFIKFIAIQKPELLMAGGSDQDKIKLFFKMIAGSAMDAIGAMAMPGGAKKLEQRYAPIMQIHPLLIKYSTE